MVSAARCKTPEAQALTTDALGAIAHQSACDRRTCLPALSPDTPLGELAISAPRW
jgi:hypothetical protein